MNDNPFLAIGFLLLILGVAVIVNGIENRLREIRDQLYIQNTINVDLASTTRHMIK